jgi:hypothetical protein
VGVIFADARNLLELRKGQIGGRAVTLGRLSVFFHGSDLKALRSLVPRDRATEAWIAAYRWGDFAEGFFRDVLKFESVDSIDFSDYQGASIIHDLGEPLPAAYCNQFDLAVDGGTLEHVFNFPQAIGNLMRLVRVEGAVYVSAPCNNLCGHGFYQFSPELMYRVFCPANGFEPIAVRIATARYVSVELTPHHELYEVADPDAARQRVNLLSSTPVLIMALARRIADVEPFKNKVLQSDYVAKWDGQPAASAGGAVRQLKDAVRRALPDPIVRHLIGLSQRRKASLGFRRHFRRVR